MVTTRLLEYPDQLHGSAAHNQALVSVIIPNYNHAHYVGVAIQSVLAQEYRPVEIIVVDDGSTDDSRAVITQFGDQVRAIWQENRGLSAARNTGLRAARGEFIAVLDADDLYEPDFISTLVPLLEADVEAGAVYCGYQFVDQFNQPLPQVERRPLPADEVYTALTASNFLVPESILVRRTCYETVGGFDEALRACEDWDMWLAISRRYKTIGTTRVLTRHRILAGSMSTDPARMFKNRMAVIAKHFGPEPTAAADWTDALRRVYASGYLTSAVEYLQANDQAGVYHCLHKMVYTDPRLLTELNTFYELGCGSQPKGYRGDFTSIDVTRNAAVLIELLDRLFNEGEVRSKIANYRSAAYANAYFALGLLSYGARRFPETRSFLLRALAHSPAYMLNRRLVTIFLKSLLGKSGFALVQQIRRTAQA